MVPVIESVKAAGTLTLPTPRANENRHILQV